jgi:alkylated DNA repair dioxygenase AlkB
MSNVEQFNKNGCVRVDGFIDPQTIAVVSQYLENKIKRGEWVEGPCQYDTTSKFAYYADPLIEVLLQASQQAVEEVTGKELIPTYSYSRVYQPGEALKPHVDRPSCEVSVTVNVATKGEFSPIYMQYGDNFPEAHVLNPGDAVVYKGCQAMHWRNPLKEDQFNVQFMLHYVDKNGPNAEFAKDKRPAYGMSSQVRSY